jgi:hypothetical protein
MLGRMKTIIFRGTAVKRNLLCLDHSLQRQIILKSQFNSQLRAVSIPILRLIEQIESEAWRK